MALKVLVYGSCVSRDMLEYDGHERSVELVDYYARSSLASLGGLASETPAELNNIKSNFQRRMVERDFSKEFLRVVENTSFDILLIDPIDERFSLLERKNGGVITISNELVSSGILDHEKGRKIRSGTEESWQYWLNGWSKLVAKLSKFGLLKKVRVNKVFWAETISTENDREFSKARIEAANEYLGKIYRRMQEDIPENQFINYPDEFVVANNFHKWGVSPFHFVDEFYIHGLSQLTLNSGQKINKISDDFYFLASESMNNSVSEFIYGAENSRLISDALDKAVGLGFLIENREDQIYIDSLIDLFFRSGSINLALGHVDCTQLMFTLLIGNYNFLVFNEGGLFYAVVQHHKFIRAVYLINDNALVNFDAYPLGVDVIKTFWAEFDSLKQGLLGRNFNAAGRSIYVSYPRPYHYFYDSLPRFMRFREAVGSSVKVLTVEDGGFFDLSALGVCNNSFVVKKNYSEVNNYLAGGGINMLIPGYAQRDIHSACDNDVEIIIKSGELVPDEFKEELLGKISRADYVIWVGLCSEKREWFQQVEAICLIHEKLIGLKKRPLYIFDGITSTVSQAKDNDSLNFQVEKELSVIKGLCVRLGIEDECVSLVGKPSWTKIYCATHADFFLASFLTDSMYPARFGKSKGIGFGASCAMHSDHIHARTFFVPKTKVEDSKSPGNWSTVSYSIDPKFCASYFIKLLTGDFKSFYLNEIGFKFSTGDSFFLHKKGEGFSFSFDMQEHKYGRLNEGFLSFEAKSFSSILLELNSSYVVNFSCFKSSRKNLSLHVVVSKQGGRVSTHAIYPGESCLIEAVEDGLYANFYFRFQGVGRIELGAISIVKFRGNVSADEPVALAANLADSKVIPLSQVRFIDNFFDGALGAHDFSIEKSGHLVDFRFVNKKSNDLVVFFNAAITRSEGVSPPFFSGNTAIKELSCNLLMVSDPSLHRDSALSLGWYAGFEGLPLSDFLAKVISAFKQNFGRGKVVLYGGSGGGFAALKVGEKIEGVTVICANPQVDILKYDFGSVQRYLKSSFGVECSGDFKDLNINSEFEFSVNYSRLKDNNSLIYLQNSKDGHHIDQHFSEYFSSFPSWISSPLNDIYFSCAKERGYFLSSLWGSGHVAPPKKFIFPLIERVLREGVEGIGEFIDDLNASSMSIVSKVNFELDSNVFNVSVVLDSKVDPSGLSYAFYIYRGSERVLYFKYTQSPCVRFASTGGGIYRVACFVKGEGISQVVKSKKITVR